MKVALVLGIVLVVLGVLSLIFRGIPYTKEEKIIDLGPIQATAETQERIVIPAFVGVILLAGGIVLVVAGARKK